MDDSSVGRVRFRNVEFDRRSGELVKDGQRVRLQEAPLNQTWTIYIDIATAFLGGDRDALISQTDVALRIQFGDPEGVFQMCLLLAMSGEPSRALVALRRTVDAGFSCLAALESHASLHSLWGFPEFESMRKTVERKHQHAVEAFESAGGIALFT
jgi:hypothetical protein